MKVESPNQVTGADAGISLLLHVERQWPGIAQFFRWAARLFRYE